MFSEITSIIVLILVLTLLMVMFIGLNGTITQKIGTTSNKYTRYSVEKMKNEVGDIGGSSSDRELIKLSEDDNQLVNDNPTSYTINGANSFSLYYYSVSDTSDKFYMRLSVENNGKTTITKDFVLSVQEDSTISSNGPLGYTVMDQPTEPSSIIIILSSSGDNDMVIFDKEKDDISNFITSDTEYVVYISFVYQVNYLYGNSFAQLLFSYIVYSVS